MWGVLTCSVQLQGVQWEWEVRGAMQCGVQLQNGVKWGAAVKWGVLNCSVQWEVRGAVQSGALL